MTSNGARCENELSAINNASPSTSPKAKKRKQHARKQYFSDKWLVDSKLKGWIEKVALNKEQARCIPCNKTMSAKYSILTEHADTDKHQKKVALINTSTNLLTLLDKLNTDFDINVKTAILRNCLLIAEHDISIKTIDHTTEVQKENFKDSSIVSGLILKRTKCTMVIKNVLAEVIKHRIKEEVRNKKISILLDESTDISCKKLLGILVRYVGNYEIKTVLLDFKEVTDATAKGLFTLLKSCLEEFVIDLKNIVGYCSDNASVMMGSKESVKQYLLQSNKFLVTNGCICHTIYLIVVSASKNIPHNIENLLQNISTYFSRSPKRQYILIEFQNFMHAEQLKILKPSATRWLALCHCIERVLKMWDVLNELFRLASFENESDVATIIYNDMSNPVTKAYLCFLKFVLPSFNKFNAFFQSNKILIHVLYKECFYFIKTLAIYFIKPSYLSDDKLLNINIHHPEYLKPLDELVVGPETKNIIDNFERNLKDKFLIHCLRFFQTAFQECLDRFPLNEMYRHFEFVNPKNALSVNYDISNLSSVIKYFNIDNSSDIIEEYASIKTRFNENEKEEMKELDILKFWLNLKEIKNWNDEHIFNNISHFALTVLCLPHGNADIERIFSITNNIKTKKRNKLSTSTLTALVRIRLDLLMKNCSCYNYQFSDDHYRRLTKNMYEKKDEPREEHEDWMTD